MISIEWRASGVFALKRGKASALVVRAAGASILAALLEWATGRGQVGSKLRDRFAASAFAKYKFTPRSSAYRKYQRKWMGEARPYVSPRRIDVSKAVTALARGNALAVLNSVRQIANTAHAVDLVTKPGGFLLSGRMGSRSSAVKITFPGMRVLNRLGAKGEKYRQEFRDLTRGGDLDRILTRADAIFQRELHANFLRVPTRKIAP